MSITSENIPSSPKGTEPYDMDEAVGCVKWQGPEPLTLPPRGGCCVKCELEVTESSDVTALMVDASAVTSLPAGVLVQTIMVPIQAIKYCQ